MALLHGSRLGPYEILAPVGAGGMGEVYRARDTRLGRTVAIKVLPAHLSDDEELRRRLEREAQMISRLSHPNICSLFDVGHENSTHYLVMEYLEGETLAQRLKKGPLPAEQILRHGREMAGALDAAHRDGIVHRDLKPGNVMLTKGGVKLLDFGLAKPERGEAKTTVASGQSTKTEYSMLTEAGHVPGTVPYMAPEQVTGAKVGSRTDIFALGVVLYEMAAGRRAFVGETRTDVITAILESEPPPLSVLQPKLPPGLGQVIRRCMAKDPDERWQTARDIAAQLGWIQEEGARSRPVAAPRRKLLERLAAVVAAVAVVWALVLTVVHLRRAPPPSPVVRFSISPPADASFGFSSGAVAAALPMISPDGRWLVFQVRDSSGANLWLRPLDSYDSRPLPGTDDAFHPFWSPDSRFVGFFANRDKKLRKIAISGGPPQTICDSPGFRGGTWSRRGLILFAPAPNEVGSVGIHRVQDTSGKPTPVTWPADSSTTHRWPVFLPDGRHFLYLSASTRAQRLQEPHGIYLGSLDSKESKLILPDASNAVYAPPGYLLFVREKTLMAIPFELKRLRTKGNAIPIAEGVQFDQRRWRGLFSVSTTGVLAYAPGGGSATTLSQMRWIDRTGKTLGTEGPPADYQEVSLSLDERKAALVVRDPVTKIADIWIRDFSSGIQTRLTFGSEVIANPIWSPDGRYVIYGLGETGGRRDIFRSATDGSGKPEPLVQSDDLKEPSHWSDDGRFISFARLGRGKDSKIETWIYSTQDGKATPFLQGPFNYQGGGFSPDGRWFTYSSDESGRWEIYVRAFPGPGGRWQVSAAGALGGGGWRQDGREMTYVSLDGKYMSVPVRPGPTFEIGPQRPLFSFPTGGMLWETRDLQRFLVATPPEDRSPALIRVVLNWEAPLRQ